MSIKLYGILTAIVLVIEFAIMQIPENIITETSLKLFDLVYDRTIKSCERLDDNRDRCLQATYNNKLAIDLIIPLSSALGFATLIIAVKARLSR